MKNFGKPIRKILNEKVKNLELKSNQKTLKKWNIKSNPLLSKIALRALLVQDSLFLYYNFIHVGFLNQMSEMNYNFIILLF